MKLEVTCAPTLSWISVDQCGSVVSNNFPLWAMALGLLADNQSLSMRNQLSIPPRLLNPIGWLGISKAPFVSSLAANFACRLTLVLTND
jgi:hypothetical protein